MGLDDINNTDSNNNESKLDSADGTAVKITQSQFESFLKNEAPEAWFTVDETGAGELVYESVGVRIKHPTVTLRIYSTVDKQSRISRPKGDDAIRLVLWDTKTENVVGGEKKTLRIDTWRKNLRSKITNLLDQWDGFIAECPKCGSVMTRRDGEYGEFFGCVRYPECQVTRQIE